MTVRSQAIAGDIGNELVERVERAAAAHAPLRIAGGGSKPFFGRSTDGDVLDVGAHRGIVDYAPSELVVTARTGTPLAEIDAALAEHGQIMAFEPPRVDGRATLGGTLACNAAGPARPWAGSIRDAVLGVKLVNGRGEALAFGGRVMKNVAGFDVSRLQAGALGAFGVLTEITVKVSPAPAATETRVREVDAGAALERMSSLARTPQPLTGAAWHRGRLYVRFAGAATAVAAAARAFGGDRDPEADAFWPALREQRLEPFTSDAPVWRFSIKSTALLPEVDSSALIDWAGAQRFVARALERADAERLAAAAGGHATLFRGGDRRGEVGHTLPAPLAALHTRLKAAFDPERILNPGRLYSWL